MSLDNHTPPIFLFSDVPQGPFPSGSSGMDVASFDSVEAMLRFVEPWDVSDGDRAFDSRGRRLRVRAEGVERTRFTVGGGATFIDESASGAVADEELAHLLREYVRRVGPARLGVNEADLASTSLDSLVAAVAPFTHTRS